MEGGVWGLKYALREREMPLQSSVIPPYRLREEGLRPALDLSKPPFACASSSADAHGVDFRYVCIASRQMGCNTSFINKMQCRLSFPSPHPSKQNDGREHEVFGVWYLVFDARREG